VRVLILETGPVTERLRVREIDDDQGQRLVRIVRRGTGSAVTWRRARAAVCRCRKVLPGRCRMLCWGLRWAGRIIVDNRHLLLLQTLVAQEADLGPSEQARQSAPEYPAAATSPAGSCMPGPAASDCRRDRRLRRGNLILIHPVSDSRELSDQGPSCDCKTFLSDSRRGTDGTGQFRP
jgi:hypothetical protein